jgi:hypothetical protein
MGATKTPAGVVPGVEGGIGPVTPRLPEKITYNRDDIASCPQNP